MLNVRHFDENPLLTTIRYKLGEALSGKLYYKIEDGFEELSKDNLKKIKLLDPNIYYGIHIKYELPKEIRDNEKFNEIFFEDEFVSFHNYISLMVIERNLDREIHHINFLIKEVFDYLDYMETVNTLVNYYSEIKLSLDYVSDKGDMTVEKDK